MASPTAEHVHLRITARQPYSPIVKAAATALGRRLDLNFADLDDLRLVMDQAMVMLLDGLEAHRSQDLCIDVVFRVDDDRLEFEASRNTGTSLSDKAVSLFTRITRGLLDDLRIDSSGGAIWLSKASSGVR